MSGAEAILAAVVVLVVLAGLAATAAVHLRWVQAIRARGWTYQGSNDRLWYRRFGCPPFDIGYERSCADRVTGEIDGREFVWFRYSYDREYGGESRRHNACAVRMPSGLPELYAVPLTVPAAERWIPGCVDVAPGSSRLRVRARDPGFATALLESAAGELLESDCLVDLAFDNDYLVALDTGQGTPEIQRCIEFLSRVIAAIPAEIFTRHGVAPKVHDDRFYRQDWSWQDRDDQWATAFHGAPFGKGEDRKAVGVVSGTSRGIPFVAYRYEWTTHEASGGSGSSDVHNFESILAVELPGEVPKLQLSRARPGRDRLALRSDTKRITLESDEFNRAFNLRCADPKLAYDIISPRIMAMLLERAATDSALEFRIEGRYLLATGGDLTTEGISEWSADLVGFIATIPGFVWHDLGLPAPAVR